MSELKVTPISPVLGAVIEGVSLSDQIEEETVGQLRSLLLRHKVIFFEDQHLSAQHLRDFARRFGKLHVHPVYPHHEDVPEIVVLDNGPDNPTDNDSWHSDATFLRNPPMGTILYAHTIPPLGGDTMWSDMRAAYLGLSEPFRNFLRSLKAIHDFESSFPADNPSSRRMGTDSYSAVRSSNPPVAHPVVRTHPETGEDCLFVNDGHTTKLLEIGENESKCLLQFLHLHIQSPQFVLRWRWRRNAVAFWDNRVTQHYAVNDYLPHRRIMYRALLHGDKPYVCTV